MSGLLRRLTLLIGLVFIGATPAGAATDIQRIVSGGVEAWLVEDHTAPVISLSLAFRGGAALDPPGKEGLAQLATTILDEGAGDLDSQAFQRRLEDLAIELSFEVDRDAFYGHLRTLAANRDEAFTLLRMALSRPRFDAEPMERMRNQLQARLRRAEEDPRTLAQRRLFATVFPQHPYGRPVEGTHEGLAAVTADDLRGFVTRRLSRDALVIGVVGAVTAADVQALLTALARDLPAAGTPPAIADVAAAVVPETIVTMPARQAAVVFAQAGLKRSDPDFIALTVVNQVLGGSGLTARLFEEVREKRGLAYGIYTTPLPFDHSALILGAAGTANERVGETVAVIRDEWRRLAREGLTEAELADAKRYLTGSYPLRFTASGPIAHMLVAIQLDHLGIDYINRRNGLIEAVTLADANRVATRLFDPARLSVVIAGGL
ncbi:MAG: pitrilysin family protein [Defluviicoccus sp.]